MLRCAGICMPNPNIVAFIVSEISAFLRTAGHDYINSASHPDQGCIYLLYKVGNASVYLLHTFLLYA